MDANETMIEVPAEVTRAIAGVERAMMKLIKLVGNPKTRSGRRHWRCSTAWGSSRSATWRSG